MKRLLSLILALSIVASLCACGGNSGDETTAPTQEQEENKEIIKVPTVEERYSHIDESKVNNKGYYQIWSAQGLLNVADKMDAKIELLRDIDLGGAVWTPMGTQEQPFTGRIDGNNFTVSNFKIEAATADGNMGFFGVNDGTVRDLKLANVTVVTTKDTRNVGGLAGINTGTFEKCSASGTIQATELAEDANVGGAVGLCTSGIYTVCGDMDITCDSGASAAVGAVAGSVEGCMLSLCEGAGDLVISGSGKTVGQLVGAAKSAEVSKCAFMGYKSELSGKTFTAFIGKADKTETESCSRIDTSREELDPELRALRDKVVQRMYEMGTVAWTVSEMYTSKCLDICTLSGCITPKYPGTQYYGFPYGHNTCSLERFEYCIDENGVVKDWVIAINTTGGMADYMASDCLRSAQMAWATVANSMNTPSCMSFINFSSTVGAILLGDLPVYTEADSLLGTTDYVKRVGEQAVYDAYCCLRAGDALVRVDNSGGGHGMMAATDPVIVRFEDGRVDPEHSCVLIHEQGRATKSTEFVTSWSINRRSSFYELMHGDSDPFLPYTIQELQEGETDIPEATLEGGVDGIYGLCMGTVKSNFFLDSVTVRVTDESGTTVFEKTMFSRIDNVGDFTDHDMFERMLTMEFDMGNFANDVMAQDFSQGQYRAVITANLHTGDHIVVKDYTF